MKVDRNTLQAARQVYRNPFFSERELLEDVKKILHIPKLVERYTKTGQFKTRLAYNNFIIACNCFGLDFTINTLWDYTAEEHCELIMIFVRTILNREMEDSEFKTLITNDLKGI